MVLRRASSSVATALAAAPPFPAALSPPQSHHHRAAAPRRGPSKPHRPSVQVRRYTAPPPPPHPRDIHPQSPQPPPPPPPQWPSSRNPSPYDIFAISRSEPYTKKRFYQLVKLYHPDLAHAAAGSPLPAATRLERYRLVVAANDVLSDPVRRHAYDAYGLGWGSSGHSAAERARHADRSWRSRPGNASRNATWEDWEQWYEARGEGQAGRRRRQETQYMPNGIFAMLVAMACMLGAMMQGQRAEQAGAHFVEVTSQRHQAVGNEVRRSTQASAGLSQDQRVDRFLRDRENVAYQFSPARYDELAKEGGEGGEPR